MKNSQGAKCLHCILGNLNISSEKGFAVKKHSENGQIKILSNDKLFDLLKAANLEVPDTMDTVDGAAMEQTNEYKIVNLLSFYCITFFSHNNFWSI